MVPTSTNPKPILSNSLISLAFLSRPAAKPNLFLTLKPFTKRCVCLLLYRPENSFKKKWEIFCDCSGGRRKSNFLANL